MFTATVQSAFGYDMENGVWKNLNEKYQQTLDNESVVSGMIFSRIYHNNTFDSDSRNNEYKDTHLKTRLGKNLKISDHLSLKTVAKFENIANSQSNADGTNRFFENEGVFLDELVLGYDYKKFSALAGKFNPNFGDAWKINNGIWINEIAKESYEQSEKLGIGLIKRAGDQKTFGEYVFGSSLFTNDRKNFDNSIITKRDRNPKRFGNAGDTRSLESYILSTDIYYDFGNDEKLSYHFAYSNLAINDRNNISNVAEKIDDQKSFVANINYKYPINENFVLNNFIEYVKINNLGGNSEEDSKVLTCNLTAQLYKDFAITLGFAKEQKFEVNDNGLDRSIGEISFAYKFDSLHKSLKGFSIASGHKNSSVNNKASNIKNNSFGAILTHKSEF
jgi:hypothetical protein